MEIEKKFFVYVDYREDDGKPFYVGKGVVRRVQDLKRNVVHSRIKNKHGMFRKTVFESHSEQETLEKEIQLIGELQTHIDHGNGGANFTLGGEGISGYKYTDEQKEKMSESHKKQWEDPEYREKMSENSKKMWEDPEYQSKISESRKKMWEDPEFRKKRYEKMREVYSDPEFRKKVGKSSKKMWEDPEHRKKVSESNKKRWEDPEFRAMMKEKQRLGWEKKRLEKLQSEI